MLPLLHFKRLPNPMGTTRTRADSKLFLPLLGAVETQRLQLLGEGYDPDGTRFITTGQLGAHVRFPRERYQEVRPRFNRAHGRAELDDPQVTRRKVPVSARFFNIGKQQYEDWPVCWWREGIQNAVDAGAKNIWCSVVAEKLPSGNPGRRVTLTDDGTGMDYAVLTERFLTLGGTGKEGNDETYGGFGEAKRLLLFPWVNYEVRTRDLLAKGSGDDQEIRSGLAYVPGVRVSVLMAEDDYTSIWDALATIRKSYLPKIKFHLEQDRLARRWQDAPPETAVADLQTRGEPVRTITSDGGVTLAHIYHNPRDENTDNFAYVRVNGLWMFNRYTRVRGRIIVEVVVPSTQVFSVSRQNFSGDYGSTVASALSGFFDEVTKDTQSALRQRAGLTRKVYAGEGARRERQIGAWNGVIGMGSFDKPRVMKASEIAAMLSGLSGRAAAPVPTTNVSTSSARDQSYWSASSPTPWVPPASTPLPPPPVEVLVDIDPEAWAVVLARLNLRGSQHLSTVITQLAWQPGFMVENQIPGFTPHAKWFPETMSKNIQFLARTWAELCRFTLMRLNCDAPFNVGFVFTESATAMYMREQLEGEKRNWLLLNPMRAGQIKSSTYSEARVEGDFDKVIRKQDAWDPRNDLGTLRALAVHECTHLVDRVDYHDEDFASAMTKNMILMADTDREARAIMRAAAKSLGKV